ncbi:MAG: hypothetical protein EBV53_16155 [Proteobacteria bacterium]|nr:hypothetical protein [Pseudomonadota bacterium]
MPVATNAPEPVDPDGAMLVMRDPGANRREVPTTLRSDACRDAPVVMIRVVPPVTPEISCK